MPERCGYIAFEGVERSGKTSQARRAVAYLRDNGLDAVYLKCGGLGGATAKLEKIKKFVFENRISDELRMRCFDATARLQNREAARCLKDSMIVVGDKSVWSCLIWEELNGVCRLSRTDGFLYPDTVFYLDIEPAEALTRITSFPDSSPIDRSHNQASLGAAVAKYREICSSRANWVRIDGSRDAETVWAEVKKRLQTVFSN